MSSINPGDDLREAAFENSYEAWVSSVEAYILEEDSDHYERHDHPVEMLSDSAWNAWVVRFQSR